MVDAFVTNSTCQINACYACQRYLDVNSILEAYQHAIEERYRFFVLAMQCLHTNSLRTIRTQVEIIAVSIEPFVSILIEFQRRNKFQENLIRHRLLPAITSTIGIPMVLRLPLVFCAIYT